MKFEVIGWTNGDDERYPDHFLEFESVERAVVKALREGGYRFDGFEHQYSPSGTPVLNDGTKAGYGMRAWGDIMAEALEEEDGTCDDYMQWYMDEMDIERQIFDGEESTHILPPEGVDRSRIVPRKALAEDFEMHLSPAAFEAVLSGKKTADIRLNDEKRRLICKGDRITFICGERRCVVRVTKEEEFDSLAELLTEKMQMWEKQKDVDRRKALVRRAFFPGCETPAALHRYLLDVYEGEKLDRVRSSGYRQALLICFKREEK